MTGLPAFSSLFSAISDVASARRQVVDASTQRIPFALLAVIFVAGLVLLGTVSLQDVRHGRAHLIAVIAVALFIALGQALVVSLSRPFSGAATVSSAPLRDGAPPQFTDCAKSEVLTSVKQLG